MKTNQDNAISGIPLGYKATAFRCPKKAELFADDDGDGKVLIYRATGDHKNICKLIVEQVAVDDFQWVPATMDHIGKRMDLRMGPHNAPVLAKVLAVSISGTVFVEFACGAGWCSQTVQVREPVTIMQPIDINKKPESDPDGIPLHKEKPRHGQTVLANMGGKWRYAYWTGTCFLTCNSVGDTEEGVPGNETYEWDKANQPEYWKPLP